VVDRIDEGSTLGLAAEFVAVERGTEFKQGGALAASQRKRGVDVGFAGVGAGVGVGAQPQESRR
jgi:hypothetical protein